MHPQLRNTLALVLAAGFCAIPEAAVAQSRPAVPRWKQHDLTRPRPPVVAPASQALPAPAPADAVVLFDGTGLSNWETPDGKPAGWTVRDGFMEVKPGSGPIQTKRGFGDVQLHVEWASPSPSSGTGQDRGNSGVFLMGRYEVQVLDSHASDTYPDGQASAIYGQYPPLFNATRAPGEWQAYDIFFRRPRFGPDGKVLEPARLTVVHNGILVQNNEELQGITAWLKTLPFEAHADRAPIQLQDHGSPVRFRNIWLREIPSRPQPLASYGASDRPVRLSREHLDRLAGVYHRGSGDNPAPITITRAEGHLRADFLYRPGALKLVPVSATEFVLTETAGRVVFNLDDQGRPTGLTFHLGGAEIQARRVR